MGQLVGTHHDSWKTKKKPFAKRAWWIWDSGKLERPWRVFIAVSQLLLLTCSFAREIRDCKTALYPNIKIAQGNLTKILQNLFLKTIGHPLTLNWSWQFKTIFSLGKLIFKCTQKTMKSEVIFARYLHILSTSLLMTGTQRLMGKRMLKKITNPGECGNHAKYWTLNVDVGKRISSSTREG